MEDANRSLHWRQKGAEEYEGSWNDGGGTYDDHGFFKASAEDNEWNALVLYIQRLLVKPPGSVPPLSAVKDEGSASDDLDGDLTNAGEVKQAYHLEA